MSEEKQKNPVKKEIMRMPAEIRFSDQLEALKSIDEGDKPESWYLSPSRVNDFIVGREEPIKMKKGNKTVEVFITRKFYGNDIMIQRAIASLLSDRPLLLIGEPGTAKSWLSENLTAAICNNSLNVIQGTAGTTEDQIKYSWNYASLIANGPSLEALVPAPFYNCMKRGEIVRFEEITRCSHEIQDTIISILSDKVLAIPELPPPNDIVFAQKGFGVIGTANTRDRGVNEMSSALKRRFNFETVHPIKNIKEEIELVSKETEIFLEKAGIKRQPDLDVIELIVTTFNEMRNGISAEGIQVAKPSVVMSTAEAVEVSVNSAMYSHYIKNEDMNANSAVINLVGSVVKDNYEDLDKLRSYFNVIIKKKAEDKGKLWANYYDARDYI
ncbi:MAG: putative ABC superfamily protein [Promethearchaeota archaeon]|nr:MAG: putative ABC superfamily protein [Candidatus Lokiarchaeota archaeon]